ncbi:MAG: hypothetical protein IPM28_02695 [Chloracidobacterium sp.]|nr:hypothetical protein [Chloracidobacterium sp.]
MIDTSDPFLIDIGVMYKHGLSSIVHTRWQSWRASAVVFAKNGSVFD